MDPILYDMLRMRTDYKCRAIYRTIPPVISQLVYASYALYWIEFELELTRSLFCLFKFKRDGVIAIRNENVEEGQFTF